MSESSIRGLDRHRRSAARGAAQPARPWGCLVDPSPSLRSESWIGTADSPPPPGAAWSHLRPSLRSESWIGTADSLRALGAAWSHLRLGRLLISLITSIIYCMQYSMQYSFLCGEKSFLYRNPLPSLRKEPFAARASVASQHPHTPAPMACPARTARPALQPAPPVHVCGPARFRNPAFDQRLTSI